MKSKTTKVKEVKYWVTECGSWQSEYYPLKIDADSTKRILDRGQCDCTKDHEVKYVIGYL